MKKLKLNRKNLLNFLNDLRKEDKEELDIFLKNHSINDFINICLKNKNTTEFLADDNSLATALGGVYKIENKGQVWLLCSNKAAENKKELFKIIKNKIEKYKKEYDYLFNYIYKSNFSALKWLKKLGFKVKEADNDFKLFYFERR